MLLSDGAAKISYGLDKAAEKTTITISNSSGRVVRTISGETGIGRHEFSWNGLDDNGAKLADGIYNFSVTAVDADNKTIGTVTATYGVVTGVETADGVANLIMGDLGAFNLDQIFAIRENESEA